MCSVNNGTSEPIRIQDSCYSVNTHQDGLSAHDQASVNVQRLDINQQPQNKSNSTIEMSNQTLTQQPI